MKIFWMTVIVLNLMVGCSSSTSVKKSTSSKHEIVLLVSRSGPNYKYLSGTEPLPNVSDEIYRFELDTLGKLKSLLGYGAYSEKDLVITINGNDPKKTVLSSKQLDRVNLLASTVYANDEFNKPDVIDGGWFVKLIVDQKVFIYNLDDAVDNRRLDENFFDIVTEIVKYSKYDVEDWRW